ncbi:MAG: fumarylacetoacetase, partial [Nitrospinaceae bacterium]|nr:fumarylacetoacetase [Nitrospinaceae bacterium]
MKSFLEIHPESHFSIHNLPYGVFAPAGDTPRVGVAIGDQILDLSVLENSGFFVEVLEMEAVFSQPSLNKFMELG